MYRMKRAQNILILKLIIKIDEHINRVYNNGNQAIFDVYEVLLMNFIWKKVLCIS